MYEWLRSRGVHLIESFGALTRGCINVHKTRTNNLHRTKKQLQRIRTDRSNVLLDSVGRPIGAIGKSNTFENSFGRKKRLLWGKSVSESMAFVVPLSTAGNGLLGFGLLGNGVSMALVALGHRDTK